MSSDPSTTTTTTTAAAADDHDDAVDAVGPGPADQPDQLEDQAAATRTATPELILLVLAAAHAAYFLYWVLARHRRFQTFDYDLGIFDQAIWLTSQGESFMTVRGLDVWGHHMEPALALYVPAYWLGAGPDFLNATMVVWLAVAVIPIYRLTIRAIGPHLQFATGDGRRFGGSPGEWLGCLVGLAFLNHFSGQWLLAETFHPEVMAITPLLFGYLALDEQRWRAAAAWLIFAVSWKEDVALAVAMLGIIFIIRKHPKPGLILLAAGTGWFLFATEVLLPAFSDGGPFYGNLYGDIGDSPLAVAKRGITDPLFVGGRLIDNGAGGSVNGLLAPFGYLAVLSPLNLIMAIPQFLASHLTISHFSYGVRNQYVAIPLTATTLATIDGLGRLARIPWRISTTDTGTSRALAPIATAVGAAVLAGGMAVSTLLWGITFVGGDHDRGLWWQNDPAELATFNAAIDLIPDDASVAGTFAFVPQLTQRSQIYRFPNPWRIDWWAADPSGAADPDTIDYLILYWPHLSEQERGEATEVLNSVDESGDPNWIVELDRDFVIVARRADR